ncbi:MAG: type II secretion system protein [Nitrospirota bacterium]
MRIAKKQTHPHLTPSPSRGGKREGMGLDELRKEKRDGMRVADCENAISSSNGFTLIEIVMTIVIVSILAALAAVIILQAVRAYSDEDSRSDVHYQARLAVERMARELRSMPSCTKLTVSSNPGGTLSFADVSTNATVTFSIAGTDLKRNNTDLLASGITSAQPFRLLAADGNTLTTACPGIWFIEISVTDTKGSQSLPIRTRVHPRNF